MPRTKISGGSELLQNEYKPRPIKVNQSSLEEAKKYLRSVFENQARPNVIQSDVIDVEGELSPRTPGNVVQRIGSLIEQGDVAAASQLAKAIKEQADVGSLFRRDLTPEALTADLTTQAVERRAGTQPSFPLTNLGVGEGERRSPFDIERIGQSDVQSLLEAIGRSQQAQKNFYLANEGLKLDRLKFALSKDETKANLQRLNKLAAKELELLDKSIRDGDIAKAKEYIDEFRDTLKSSMSESLSLAKFYEADPANKKKYLDEFEKTRNKLNKFDQVQIFNRFEKK